MSFTDRSSTSIKQSFNHGDHGTDLEQITLLTKNALDNGDYDTVIHLSSIAMDGVQEKSVQLLKMRVVAWAQKGRYVDELIEASTMIQHAPHDATGYLCTGNRYVEQGYRTKAVEVFENGLRSVSKADPQYRDIRYSKRRALALPPSLLVDIIARSPFDIMCLIVDRLPHMTLAQCLYVSSVWRQRLLAYPGCWQKIHIDEEERYGDLSDARSVHRILSLASHHIREISFVASFSMATICMESIKTKNFSNLQSLRIQGANNFKKRKCRALLYACLPNVANSLTSLDLYLRSDYGVQLSQILKLCRRLTAIRFVDHSHDSLSGLALPFTTSLRKVELTGSYNSLRTSNLVDLYKCSPELRHIKLERTMDDGIYAIVSKHCPNIKTLKVAKEEAGPTYKLCDYTDAECEESTGLLSLDVEQPPTRLTVSPLLEKYCTTLRAMRISFRGLKYPPGYSLSSFAFCSLTALVLQNVPETIIKELPTILSRCSKLESIRLRGTQWCIPFQAFQAAVELKNLTLLHLRSAICFEDAILTFLRGVQEHKQDGRPGLKDLNLHECTGVTQDVVVACAAIDTLTSLYIKGYVDMGKNNALSFASGIGRLPHLEDLYLAHINLRYEESLPLISESKSLKKVQLINIYDLSEEQVSGAFDSHVNLTFIKYDPNNDCSWEEFMLFTQ